jgi:hypothetical protein
LSPEDVASIKKRGCVVIRNVVDDEEALGWKQAVKDYVEANPSVPGLLSCFSFCWLITHANHSRLSGR